MRLRLALLTTLALAGCDRTPTTTVRDGVVDLTVRDYRYDHQTVHVRQGRITFRLTNDGLDPTNFRVRRGDVDVIRIATLDPGQSGSASLELHPGTYVMYSSVGRHETLGEYGTLVVTR